jgi:hypothetical protein
MGILDGTKFEGKKFDLINFAISPKCQDNFGAIDGPGCLMTAFIKAWGFSEKEVCFGSTHKGYETTVKGDVIGSLCSELAELLLDVDGQSFTESIVTHYDSKKRECKNEPEIALNLIWTLIEAIPEEYRINFNVNKEQVILPEPCKV